jgi:hypothetical protein
LDIKKRKHPQAISATANNPPPATSAPAQKKRRLKDQAILKMQSTAGGPYAGPKVIRSKKGGKRGKKSLSAKVKQLMANIPPASTYVQKTYSDIIFGWNDNQCEYGYYVTCNAGFFTTLQTNMRLQGSGGPILVTVTPQANLPQKVHIHQNLEMVNNSLLPIDVDVYLIEYKQTQETPLAALLPEVSYLTNGTISRTNMFLYPSDLPHFRACFKTMMHKKVHLPAGSEYNIPYNTTIKHDLALKSATSLDILPGKTYAWLVRGQGCQGKTAAGNAPGYTAGVFSAIVKTIVKLKYDGDGTRTLSTYNNLAGTAIDTETGPEVKDNL